MIIGDCPYKDCGNLLMTAFSHHNVELPKFVKVECDACKRLHWLYLSRIDPARYTLEDFDKEWEVDETTKSISKRVNWESELEID